MPPCMHTHLSPLERDIARIARQQTELEDLLDVTRDHRERDTILATLLNLTHRRDELFALLEGERAALE